MSKSDAPIPIAGFDHISIAVPDLDAATELYRTKFGCVVSEPIDIPKQGIRMAYVDLGNAKIELMQPLDQSSPIAKFLERNPAGGIHHFCMTTADANSAAVAATAADMRVLADPTPGHHGRQLFFLHPKDSLGTLIEIEETE
mgnify:CR=1 FL=1